MHPDGFQELAQFQAVGGREARPRSNVIKAGDARHAGVRAVAAPEQEGEGARVVLHREGERVVSAEISCPCGRSATLHFDYAPEEPAGG